MKLKKLSKKERENIGTIMPLTSSNLRISISNEVSVGNLILAGKKVELVQFRGGGNGIIIDDVLFKFEIMAYHYDESKDVDTDLTLTDLGIDRADLESAEIEETE